MNSLSNESSPYLLQHRNNPVEWFPWNDHAWQRAHAENKLVLISIGYSACHWCHVMEKEVFEDYECAELMNRHFISIKVDREERPDIDSIYMDAIHLMGGRGGWPLNVFVLPDGRPIYGGTYFPKHQWIGILENLSTMWKDDPARMKEYAVKLQAGLSEISWIQPVSNEHEWHPDFCIERIGNWSRHWDLEKGGNRGAPKFPMPNNHDLLLQYGHLMADENAIDHVKNSLRKMALGGIYDQVGGGFCRYSVDDHWKVPHFEKMLYDNAQLISLYSRAFQQSGDRLFLHTAIESAQWVLREMTSDEGLYYAALDADSEGVEGKFYVWTENELREILRNDFDFASNYYAVGKEGFWEHEQNILLRTRSDENFAQQYGLSREEVEQKRIRVNGVLLEARNQRVRPGLDYKCITSWNALMIEAFVDLFRAGGDNFFLQKAEDLFVNLKRFVLKSNGELNHIRTNGVSSVIGFLDDYVFLAQACLKLYESTGNAAYLQFTSELVEKAIKLFYNAENGLFYFTPNNGESLILRKSEVQDNVMPSSNSVLAKVLFQLSIHQERSEWEHMSKKMLLQIVPQMSNASGYSNWLQLYLWYACSFNEIIVTGKMASSTMKKIQEEFLPNCLFAASTMESELPLFKNRFSEGSAIYVCRDKSCFPPTDNIQEVLALLH